MFDLGGAAGRAHALVGFFPGGEGGVLGIGYRVWGRGWGVGCGVCPVGDGGFVAPFDKVRHGGLVGSGEHELAHTFFAVPGGHGPEGEVLVGEECAGKEAGCAADLVARAESVEQEGGEEADGADAEAGEGDEGHGKTDYRLQMTDCSSKLAFCRGFIPGKTPEGNYFDSVCGLAEAMPLLQSAKCGPLSRGPSLLVCCGGLGDSN
jgi:hypothetical protein